MPDLPEHITATADDIQEPWISPDLWALAANLVPAEQLAAAERERDLLARQLRSITDLCDRARLGLVRTAAVYQLLTTDPADEETS